MCRKHRSNPSRRDFLRSTAGAAAATVGLPTITATGRADPGAPASVDPSVAPSTGRPHLEIAVRAATWLERLTIPTEHGVTWPADAADPTSVGTSLYTHSPGVVLFFLELHRTTGDDRYLELAKAGADELAVQIDAGNVTSAGLYTGLAGLLFCLSETFRASADERYRAAAQRCLRRLDESARRVGSGTAWPIPSPNTFSTDIISGNAGTGLTLLYAHRVLADAPALDLAREAGRFLLGVGRPDAQGLKWAAWEDYPRLMPNFSHGTAGVSYFLASLSQVTGERRFLEAAQAGARYLDAIATKEGKGWRIFHHEPEGEDLYYLSWCHGPAGTARLYARLGQITGDPAWMELVLGGAQGIMQTPIPEQRTPGFWNNISQCCGDCGVGEFFRELYQSTGHPVYRRFLSRVTANLLQQAADDGDVISWTQAEHRVRPQLLQAQTGYMQGAAGVGAFFLHLDMMQRETHSPIVWPDSPFRQYG